jgi:hypothetical protein
MRPPAGLLPPGFEGTSTRIKHLSQAAEGFQVWSSTLYIAAGVLGAALACGMPIALGRRGRIATRVVVLLVSYMVVVTGLVSTWYHRIGTDDACPHDTFKGVQRVDVGCASATAVAGICVVVPLTIVGLVRSPAAGPAVMLVMSAGMGAAATVLHMRLHKHNARELRPCVYDAQHGSWHVLSAMSAALGFVAAFVALMPARAMPL